MELNARPITEDDPNVITVVDQNSNNDLIKTENIEEIENRNEQNIRKSTRLRSTNPINRYGNPIMFRLLQVTPLMNGAQRITSKRVTTKRPSDLKKANSERKEEEYYTEQTVYKTFKNIWTVRCYHYQLKFEFISVLSIYVYTCSYLLKKGECGMTSLHAVMYMYPINSSNDILVPVKDATARYYADLFINF